MSSSIRHVAVMVDGSAAAERALLEAAAIADEHGADLTVIAPVPHDRRTDGSAVRAVRRAAWNRTLDAAAEADLANARALLGEREPEPRYRAVSGSVVAGVRREVARLGCDLLVLPRRGRFRNGQARRAAPDAGRRRPAAVAEASGGTSLEARRRGGTRPATVPRRLPRRRPRHPADDAPARQLRLAERLGTTPPL